MKRYKLTLDVKKAFADLATVGNAIAQYKDSDMTIEILNFDYLLTFGSQAVINFINCLPLKDEQDVKLEINIKLDYLATTWFVYKPNDGSISLVRDLLERKVILEVDNLPFNIIYDAERLIELGRV
ncbi:hypothetical protein [Entomomonas asaccharolytica]|uniref:Uncharacterized protein n=1 Tax=Entomomonas asaccharolytica TaxID=2785331 RepID=A0A974RVW0_9GAMM|nr:hypothetical protein [Entomomonas asaccharolytica]QQP84515.1 hypothetical protein JHT90_08800 [Entomomonas asaccharolytica]